MNLGDKHIKGYLIDLDGVLYVGNRPIPGAVDFVDQLVRKGIPHCFLTNTTTRTAEALRRKLNEMQIQADTKNILTAPGAAKAYLNKKGYTRCHLVVNSEVKGEFESMEYTGDSPEAVVIGDIGDEWTYHLLNQIFRSVSGGAELVALHKNKFWETEDGLQLDIGAFVAGVEYATGQSATLMGKPEAAFFDAALNRLGLRADQVVMIGDDVDTDIGGAQENGIAGVLVKTGKFREDYFKSSGIQPDRLVDSIQDLVNELPADSAPE